MTNQMIIRKAGRGGTQVQESSMDKNMEVRELYRVIRETADFEPYL